MHFLSHSIVPFHFLSHTLCVVVVDDDDDEIDPCFGDVWKLPDRSDQLNQAHVTTTFNIAATALTTAVHRDPVPET